MSLYVPGDRIVAAYNIAENHAIALTTIFGLAHEVVEVFVSPSSLKINTVITPPATLIDFDIIFDLTHEEREVLDKFTNPTFVESYPDGDEEENKS